MIILLMLWKFFLRTVKNDGRKFVDFGLRKSIFFLFILMFLWKLAELHRSSDFMHKKKRWILMKLSKFPTWTSEWTKKKMIFSARNPTNFRPLFFTVFLNSSFKIHSTIFLLVLFPTIQDFKFFSCVFFHHLSRRSESLKWIPLFRLFRALQKFL
jgi:hypothetical protein